MSSDGKDYFFGVVQIELWQTDYIQMDGTNLGGNLNLFGGLGRFSSSSWKS